VVVTGNDEAKTMQKAFASRDQVFSSETCRQAETNQPLQGRSGEDGRETPSIRARSASDGGNLPSWVSQFPSMSSNISQGGNPFRGGMFPVTRNSRLTNVSSSRRAVKGSTLPGLLLGSTNNCGPGVPFTQVASSELQLIRDLIGGDDSESTEAGSRPI